MIIVLVGRTASGKTTLAEEFERRGFERIITYTTRQMRPGEVDGVDYHFISEDEFFLKEGSGYFAEVTHYEMANGVVYYGSAWTDYYDFFRIQEGYYYQQKKNKVVVLNPQGVRYLMSKTDLPDYANLKVVWVNPAEDILMLRLCERGDDFENIRLRFEIEKPDFEMLRKKELYDLEVTQLLPPNELADYILREVGYSKWTKR